MWHICCINLDYDFNLTTFYNIMYFSDNEYYSLVESIKDLHNFTILQKQSLTDNTKVLISLNNSYQNNAQSILKLLL